MSHDSTRHCGPLFAITVKKWGEEKLTGFNLDCKVIYKTWAQFIRDRNKNLEAELREARLKELGVELTD